MEKDKLKAAMSMAGKTQAQTAKDIGLSPQAFQNKLSRGELSQADLRKIAKACGAVYHEFIEFPDGTKIIDN